MNRKEWQEKIHNLLDAYGMKCFEDSDEELDIKRELLETIYSGYEVEPLEVTYKKDGNYRTHLVRPLSVCVEEGVWCMTAVVDNTENVYLFELDKCDFTNTQ